MSDYLDRTDQIEAKLDKETFAAVVNGDPDTVVVSRLGQQLMTLSSLPIRVGHHHVTAARAANAAALPAFTYNNNTTGVGSTMMATANAALVTGGVAMAAGDRFWHWDYTGHGGANIAYGLWTVTQVGDGSHPWIATRATDADTSAELSDIRSIVEEGTHAGKTFGLPVATVTIGTTPLCPFVDGTAGGVDAEAVARAAADAQKSDIVPPQSGLTAANNELRRYPPSAWTVPGADGYMSLSSYAARLNFASVEFNQNIWDNFGEPSVLRIANPNAGVGEGYPVGGRIFTLADLKARNCSLDGSDFISVKCAIDTTTLVNQTIDTGSVNSSGQQFLVLRYDGPDGDRALTWNQSNDVMLLDNFAPSFGSNLTDDGTWIGKAGALYATGGVKGRKWENVPLPVTFGGNALTCVLVITLGNSTAAGATSFDLCNVDLVRASTIDTAAMDFGAGDRPPGRIPAASALHELSLNNTDIVAVIGDSLGETNYALRDKAWIAKVSAATHYTFVNFANSGDTAQNQIARILSGNMRFGLLSFADVRARYAFVMLGANDQNFVTSAQFQNDIRALARLCASMGTRLIFATELARHQVVWGNATAMIVESVAREVGALFCDIAAESRIMDVGEGAEYADHWNGVHPATRTVAYFTNPIAAFFNNVVGPPQCALEILRLREGVAISTHDDLRFRTLMDRERKWNKISPGHSALTPGDSEASWDLLVTNVGSYTTSAVVDEALALRTGFSIAVSQNYALIEATFPGQPLEVTLLLDDPDITVLRLDALEMSAYQDFAPTGSPSLTVGAVYTSGDGSIPGHLTYAGNWDGFLHFTPLVAMTNRGSGTLSKFSGTGDSSITYSASRPGFDPNFISASGEPNGHAVEIANDGAGRFQLSAKDLRGKFDGRTLRFFLYKSGGFSIGAPRVLYRLERVDQSAFQPRNPATGAIIGTLLLNNAAALAGAGTILITGAVTSNTPADGVVALRPDTGAAMVPAKCITVDGSNYVTWTITGIAAEQRRSREIEIRIACRAYPASGVTADTFDDREVLLYILAGSSDFAIHRTRARLAWGTSQATVRTILPPGATSLGMAFQGGQDGAVQIAWAEVQFV